MFLKLLTKKSQYILWAGASYGPGNTVLFYYLPMWFNVQVHNEIFIGVHFNATSVYLQ